ncbi:MMPL family transporter [Polaromonas eurypsychrophila]|uniref:Membrane protein n=1 Tax=Polaromonas eurypsychrophila TaxID=1614635 RepID=A0A916WCR9_9BURK|nr:MMPL family transporter [Polaromonas eurypsychrophila]GGA87066.1 membrane protein [Polaromonas eurypsychrophila]
MTKGFFQARLLPVWVWLATLLLCGVLVARTHFTADMSAFLPRSPTPEQQLLVDQLRDGLVSRLILVAVEGGDPASRAAASGAMAGQLRGDKRFTTVSNGESGGMQRDQAFLFEHRYLLSPAVTPARFSVGGLRAAIGDTLDLLASPAGLLTKSLLPRDPTGEIPLLLEEFSGDGGSGANRPNVAGGVWASRDGQRALLLVQTVAPGSDTDAQEEAIGAVRTAFAQAPLTGTPGQAMQLVVTGPGVFAVQARETIKREVTRTSVISMILMLTLLIVIYRSLTTLALGMVPVVSGTVAGIVAVSLGFGEVHGITLGFGTTLIGEAVDYSIYLFVQSERTATSKTDWVRRFWPTIRLGVLTSVAGFASLLFSGFPGLAQLGLYSIVGLLTAAAVTRFVMPLLLPAGFRVRDVSALGERLSVWVRFAPRLKWAALALMVLACVPLAMHRDKLWNHELSGLSPISLADQMQDTTLRADLGAPDVRYLVVISAATQEQVLQAAEGTVQALQGLVERKVITGVDTPTRFLPSMATQQARLASLPPAAQLKESLAQAVSDLPIQAARLAPFLADAEAARQSRPLQRADLTGTTLAVAVDGMLLQRGASPGRPAGWSALLPLHAPVNGIIDAAAVRQVLADAPGNRATGSALFVDLKGEADRLYSGYLREAIVLSLAGLAAVALLLLLSLRSAVQTLRVLAPPAAAIIVVLGGLALAGHRLTILHLIGLLLVVAVGSNYALFFNSGPRRSGPEDETARADREASGITPRTLASLLFANLTTVAGFGVLAISSVPVFQAIGLTVGPGSVLVLLFSAIFAAQQSSALTAPARDITP